MNENLDRTEQNRHIGIELLRIVSMFMVIILHCLLFGGVLKNVPNLTTNYNIAWLLETLCYGAVDIYALITGYVCIKSNYKFNKIFSLWLQVVALCAICVVIFPIIYDTAIDKKLLLRAFFPITSKAYWYFSSYIPLFLLMPYINKWLLELKKPDFQRLVVLLFITFSFGNVLATLFGQDPFNLNRGYSFLWLLVLYIFGAYIKLHYVLNNKFKYRCLITFFVLSVLAWLSKICIVAFNFKRLLHLKNDMLLISYTSPLIVLAAVALFLFFVNLNLQKYKKYICSISALTFGVYIIHLHPMFMKFVLRDALKVYVKASAFTLMWRVFALAIFIYVVCSLVEYFRQRTFAVLNVDGWLSK